MPKIVNCRFKKTEIDVVVASVVSLMLYSMPVFLYADIAIGEDKKSKN